MGTQRSDGKEVIEFFPLAARTATANATSAVRSSQGLFLIDVTAASATPSVVFTISGIAPDSGTLYTILASAAITGTGLTVLRVSPHLTAAANTIAKDILPSAIKIAAAHGDTDSITYSVRFIGSDP